MKGQRYLCSTVMVLAVCLTSASGLLAQDEKPRSLTLPEIINRIQPSTVLIITYDKDGKATGKGSGFFVHQSGQIITNRHVLARGVQAKIKTAQGKTYPITHIITEDKSRDLVRVSVDIPLEAVWPLQLDDSIPQAGERIVVIGNPLGLEGTVSDGIVSAVRDIPVFGRIIQISAPISAGSSGSPVVDMEGRVVGIATFQIAQGQNLNFAVPARRAARLKPRWLISVFSKPKTLVEWQQRLADRKVASAERDYRRGLVQIWKKDYKRALPFFERAAKKNPQYARAWFYIGRCKSELGQNTEAVEAYKQAIRLKPDYAKFHNYLGLVYRRMKRYEEAIAAYKEASRIDPDYAKPHNNLGFAYGRLGRYDEAITAYNEAISINPDYAKAYNNLGYTYCRMRRYDEAITAYEEAIRIDPDYATPYNNLGGVYRRLERYEEAIAAYREAIRIDPDYAMPHDNLGYTYRRMKRYEEAIAAYKEVIRIDSDHAEAHYNLGSMHLKVGDKDSAQKQYEILKKLDGDLADKLLKAIHEKGE